MCDWCVKTTKKSDDDPDTDSLGRCVVSWEKHVRGRCDVTVGGTPIMKAAKLPFMPNA